MITKRLQFGAVLLGGGLIAIAVVLAFIKGFWDATGSWPPRITPMPLFLVSLIQLVNLALIILLPITAIGAVIFTIELLKLKRQKRVTNSECP